MKKWIIELLGGYADAESALKDKKNRHYLLTEAVKDLFPIVGPEDVLRRDNKTGFLVFRGRQMTKSEEDVMRDEAIRLLSTKLWHVLRTDVKYAIQKKMFEEANDELGMMVGKLMLFYDHIIKARLEMFAGKKDTSMV